MDTLLNFKFFPPLSLDIMNYCIKRLSRLVSFCFKMSSLTLNLKSIKQIHHTQYNRIAHVDEYLCLTRATRSSYIFLLNKNNFFSLTPYTYRVKSQTGAINS
jgi:hypothetical protein